MSALDRSSWAFISNSFISAFSKGITILYLLLLPILYAEQRLAAVGVGYIGALLLIGVLCGGLAIGSFLHRSSKAVLFIFSCLLLVLAMLPLLFTFDALVLNICYFLIGFADGLIISTSSAIAADLTVHGRRFGPIAKMQMLTDVVRIGLPATAAGLYVGFGLNSLLLLALIINALLAITVVWLLRTYTPKEDAAREEDAREPIRKNKSFLLLLEIEFLDSIASAQLYVFLPILFVAKHFTIESAIAIQSAVFAGYFAGRWIFARAAQKWNGYISVGIAELGMTATIILILIIPASIVLYGLSFLLGICTRGTSPVLKSMAFDFLTPAQVRRGSALYVVTGETGNAVAQLAFGLLFAWLGIQAPFIGAAVCAGFVAFVCLLRRKDTVQ